MSNYRDRARQLGEDLGPTVVDLFTALSRSRLVGDILHPINAVRRITERARRG